MFGSQTVSPLSRLFRGLRFHYLRWECVCTLGGGNAIWKICKRNCLSMNVGSHLMEEKEGSSSGIGVQHFRHDKQGLCLPWCVTWAQGWALGTVEAQREDKEAVIPPERSNLPLGGWKGSDCRAGVAELPCEEHVQQHSQNLCISRGPFGYVVRCFCRERVSSHFPCNQVVSLFQELFFPCS